MIAGRAVYIAASPEGLDIQFEGYWGTDDGIFEEMPVTDNAADAIRWGLARTDDVLIRFEARRYFWAGRGPAPTGDPPLAGTVSLAD